MGRGVNNKYIKIKNLKICFEIIQLENLSRLYFYSCFRYKGYDCIFCKYYYKMITYLYIF